MITNRNLLKPYQCVRVELPSNAVEMGRRTYTGELLSFPIPVDSARPRIETFGHVQAIETNVPEMTIMVRRVPGHPGTLDEVPVSYLWAMNKGDWPLYVHYAVVSPKHLRSSFPEDMLRYEHAVPVNFKLFIEDERLHYERCDKEDERLIIATTSRRKLRDWTYGRWNSFMWRCEHLKTEKFNQGG